MQRTAVTNSTNIAAIGPYSEESKTLIVEFTNGGVYKLTGVAKQTVDEFMASPSKGSYYGKNLRGKYDTEKIHKNNP